MKIATFWKKTHFRGAVSTILLDIMNSIVTQIIGILFYLKKYHGFCRQEAPLVIFLRKTENGANI